MKFLLALILLVLSATVTYAQSDFLPGLPPINQPFVPGPIPPGNWEDYASGRIGSQTLTGVRKGSTVYFDFVLDWWGLGPLSASPMSDAGNDFAYAGNPDNLTERWGHPGIGYFCIRCRWRFTATADNPTIWIEYLGSPRFGAHLEIQFVLPAQWHISTEAKNKAQSYATMGMLVTNILGGGAALTCAMGQYLPCATLAAGAFGASTLTIHFQTVANDPWDPEYNIPYDPVLDTFGGGLDWICPQISVTDSIGVINWHCPLLVDAIVTTNALMKGLGITLNRLESCHLVGDPCSEWQRDRVIAYLNESANWLGHLGDIYYIIGTHLPYENAAYYAWYGLILKDAAANFRLAGVNPH